MARGNLKTTGKIKAVGTCIMRRLSTRHDVKLYHELIVVKKAGCSGELKTIEGMNGLPLVACEKHLEEIEIAKYILRSHSNDSMAYKSR